MSYNSDHHQDFDNHDKVVHENGDSGSVHDDEDGDSGEPSDGEDIEEDALDELDEAQDLLHELAV